MKIQRIEVPALDAKAIGQRLRAARKSYRWSLNDLARATGLASQTIATFECGSRTPSLGSAVRLSVALRRTLDFLLLGRGARQIGSNAGRGGRKSDRRRSAERRVADGCGKGVCSQSPAPPV